MVHFKKKRLIYQPSASLFESHFPFINSACSHDEKAQNDITKKPSKKKLKKLSFVDNSLVFSGFFIKSVCDLRII